jgi:hypothetical protein
MGWDGPRTAIAAVIICLGAVVASVGLAGCGGGDSSSEEVDAAYLRVARHLRQRTFVLDRAAEHPAAEPRRLAREFRSFARGIDYPATFLLTVHGVGPVSDRALVLRHSLVIYEFALRSVARSAHGEGRRLERGLEDVRRVGVEVRSADARWERVLRAAIAG